ncbi:MAG: FAD-dependent oxidoreductase [Thermoleophilia bacterium]|nr:FAD-dependent oxidoreductase [Thermoleophilia bacterium]
MAGNLIRIKTEPLEERLLNALNDSGKCPNYVRRMPPCKNACPSSEDIRGYLTQIAQAELFGRSREESLDEAWHILTDKNPFPAVHGRVCPHPCENSCNRNARDRPLSINNLERFIGDHGLRRGLRLRRLTDRRSEKKVAVIGAGPSGLSCAYQLARRGYPVTVYEDAGQAGGMLRTGIPHYRLPRDILDAEIENILDLGIETRYGIRAGRDVPLEQLRQEYDAVYAAVGAQAGVRLAIEGEDLPGVYSGVDFLHRVNSGSLREAGGAVIVIGGGNAAIDAARVAMRLGSAATIVYRRSRMEMPAIPEEIREAKRENVGFEFLAAPVRIRAGGPEPGGEAAGEGPHPLEVIFIRMELGEPDESRRRRPVPVSGSEFIMRADTVVAALGQRPDLEGIEGLAGEDGWGAVQATRESAISGVFIGGDVIAQRFATYAVGEGRMAARAIAEYLRGRTYRQPYIPAPVRPGEIQLKYYDRIPRNDHGYLPLEERARSFAEVNLPLPEEDAIAETRRCMSCGLCFVCDRCRIYCCQEAISKDLRRRPGRIMFTDYAKCVGCGTCAEVCPCHYIEMGY